MTISQKSMRHLISSNAALRNEVLKFEDDLTLDMILSYPMRHMLRRYTWRALVKLEFQVITWTPRVIVLIRTLAADLFGINYKEIYILESDSAVGYAWHGAGEDAKYILNNYKTLLADSRQLHYHV